MIEFEPHRMYIPSIGFKFKLIQDWNLTLYAEHRNVNFATKIGIEGTDPSTKYSWRVGFKDTVISIPKDTVLKVARIYIRVGAKDFDSVTFTVVQSPDKKFKGRFWAKLKDVNQMIFEPWTDFSEL